MAASREGRNLRDAVVAAEASAARLKELEKAEDVAWKAFKAAWFALAKAYNSTIIARGAHRIAVEALSRAARAFVELQEPAPPGAWSDRLRSRSPPGARSKATAPPPAGGAPR